MNDHNSTAEPVVIRTVEAFAIVEELWGARLAQEFSFERFHFRRRVGSRSHPSVGRESLFARSADGTYVFPVGLIERIVNLLKGRGVEVAVFGQDKGADLVHDDTIVQSAGVAAQALFQSVIEHPRGQIVVRNEQERYRLIAQICRLYPTAKILIVAPTRKAVNKLFYKVGYPLAYNLGRVTSRSKMDQLSYPRLVATYQSGCLYAHGLFNIVIYASAETLAGAQMFKGALKISCEKTYGFVVADQQHSARTQLVIEGVCGRSIFEVPHPHGPRVNVRVTPVEAPWSPAPASDSAHERFDQAIRRNDRRNRFVAGLAQAIDSGNVSCLRTTFTSCLARLDDVTGQDESPRVVVVAEDPVHGHQLRQELRDWPLVTWEAGRRTRRLGNREKSSHYIVTLLALHKLRRFDFDVMIWACGSSSPLELPGFPPRTRERIHRSIRIVDILDDFDDRTEREARDRLGSYVVAGWTVESDGIDTIGHRVQRIEFPETKTCTSPR